MALRLEGSVEALTYRELEAVSARAAAALAARGVRAGDRCAILAENSPGWCAVYLGVLRLGAVAVPFDTSYTSAQVGALLRDCQASILVASARFEQAARAAAGPGGCAVAGLEETTAFAGDVPDSPAGPGDPAVILYTSGTTADPKGVVLTHDNLLAERNGAFAIVEITERDAVLGVLPLFHALAQMANLLLPLSAGARVVFLEAPGTAELLRALSDEGISVFVCVPQFFYLLHRRVMTEAQARGSLARGVFRGLLRANAVARGVGVNMGPRLFRRVHRPLGLSMRLLVTGGSKFDEAVGRDLYALGFNLLQAYGLTETSGAATVTRPGEPIDTVGRPLPGVEIRIAPPAPEGDGRDGEILIGGPIVMAGYWSRPDATGEVLRDGWLHTGDLGRLDARGRLVVTGRSKEVIVLSSGKNVYPEEIEAHYLQSPFIGELCVMPASIPGEPAAERLHAIVTPDREVLRERRIVNVKELIRFELEGLSVSLPAHKRVLGFDVTMEPLARTTTGKLKRHEIAARYGPGARRPRGGSRASSAAAAADAGTDPHLARVVAIVAGFAGAPAGPGSSLELDLGLDSMERVELIASLEQRFGMPLDEEAAQSVFTVRDLAEAFRGSREAPQTDDDLSWETLLAAPAEGPELRALLAPRSIAAPVIFVLARIASRVFARTRASGLERLPDGPCIIAPNHQSYLDPIALMGALPYAVFRRLFFVGAAEYFQTPLASWLARKLNLVPVDPDANLLPAMQAGAYGLRHGKALVLFPEGERSIDGRVKTFRKGAAILSHHLGVPIVPVAIDGVFDIWARNRPIAWRKLLPWSGHHVRVAVGSPLAPGEGTYAEQTSRLRDKVEEMWDILHSGAADENPREEERKERGEAL